ncbi:MAG TPA: glycosyltransferase [Puia sp.]|jgi:glycosyltransferase involved in cell wall biosynthesis|nr:glycosyltransferase [Puia sp.]
MTEAPLISVCIPAYKNIGFLRRLLDSIAIQTFRDFEVVVTDDSPDETVGQLCTEYVSRFRMHYFRNAAPLGTPENWNEAVRKARGEWIKIMHDDDWFAAEDSLAEYAAAISGHPETNFIFSAYRDVFLDEGRQREMFLPRRRFKTFLRNKSVLFARNIIGAPSVVLYKRLPSVEFDPNIKWVVDIDFYIRYLGARQPVYIDRILVNVGLGKMQVTQDCRRPEIEIPENFYLLGKVGNHNLRNILVYDAWWRLMRNLEVRKMEDISGSGYHGPIAPAIRSMVSWQRLLPQRFWKFGILSKTGMFLNYLANYYRIPAS